MKAVASVARGAAAENDEAYAAAYRNLDEWSAINVKSLVEKHQREHCQENRQQNIEETITYIRDYYLKLVQMVIDFRDRNTTASY